MRDICLILRDAGHVVKMRDCPAKCGTGHGWHLCILVWPTSWTPAVGGLIVCVCARACVHARARVRACVSLSEDMSPYCSAHDEWLIMKLCMYVGYHDANNVSTFGGDPVTQFKYFFYFVPPKTCRHIARHVINGWLWNFARMSGSMMPTMCQILVVNHWPN